LVLKKEREANRTSQRYWRYPASCELLVDAPQQPNVRTNSRNHRIPGESGEVSQAGEGPEMSPDQIESELKNLATKEALANLRADIHDYFGDFRSDMRKDFGDFRSDLQKALGDFRVDVVKTLWLTQLSMAGLILVGVGLLIHFHL
jgi:hypothetical protein